MDFHVLTKKQAHCLKQIEARKCVSSFFEPLRVVRELEALRLVEMFRTDEFDSGFGYRLTGTGAALAQYEGGTKYSLLPMEFGSFVFIHSQPEPAPESGYSEALKKSEQDNLDLRAEVEHLNKVIDERNEHIRAQREAIEELRQANCRLFTTVGEKNQVISNLQRTVNDYAERNKVSLQVIKNLEARVGQALPLVRHADGGDYEVIGLAKGAGDCCDQGVVQVYRALSDGRIWYRSVPDFSRRFVDIKKS